MGCFLPLSTVRRLLSLLAGLLANAVGGLTQSIIMAINADGGGPAVDEDHTGPTDDGQIITSLAGLPADPYCCQGPTPVAGGEASCTQRLPLLWSLGTCQARSR